MGVKHMSYRQRVLASQTVHRPVVDMLQLAALATELRPALAKFLSKYFKYSGDNLRLY